jgi:hypothetical protein
MNKDKIPEVGDIWIDKDDKYKKYIIISADYRTQTITILDKHFWKSSFNYELFTKYYTYLSKSKANIEQLFEVEDNERCIEDNTPHAESTVLFKDLENEE